MHRRPWPCLLWSMLLAACVGCARLPMHAVLPSATVGDPAFAALLEAYGGAPIVEGNAVNLLLNGDAAFAAQLAAIRGAARSITYAQYYWDGGDIARRTAHTLAERCRAGLPAEVLLDGFGGLPIPSADVTTMREAGCRVEFFRPLSDIGSGRLNHRNHRRILVVDGVRGFTGGIGISDKWAGDGRQPGHWRDTDVEISGPAARFLQAAFAESWLEATGVVLGHQYFPAEIPAAGTVRVQIVTSSPAKGDFAVYTTLLLALASARESIRITNPYFLPDARTTEALTQAVRRGVRVRVLVPGEIDHNLVRHASRRDFGSLLAAGIEIYEYRASLLHAKTVTIDGVWATVGTPNIDSRSLALNAEINAIFYDRGVARRLEAVFDDDLRYARRVDHASWSQRPLWQRLLELLAVPLESQL